MVMNERLSAPPLTMGALGKNWATIMRKKDEIEPVRARLIAMETRIEGICISYKDNNEEENEEDLCRDDS